MPVSAKSVNEYSLKKIFSENFYVMIIYFVILGVNYFCNLNLINTCAVKIFDSRNAR